MASQPTSNAVMAPTPPPTYSIDDMNLTRLSCIHKKVLTRVMHYVFKHGSSIRPSNMPLLDFYTSNGITNFAKNLFAQQKKKVIANPDGTTFDITLLYCCLRFGYHGLAGKDDPKWNRTDQASLESLLSIIKNKRNHLCHEQPSYNNQEFLQEVVELKDIVVKTIRFCEQLFHIPNAVTNQEILDVESDIDKYQHDEFEPKTFEEYKKQLFFDAQCDFVNSEGLNDVLDQYEKRFEGAITTVNHLVDIVLPLDDVYTELKLQGELDSGSETSTCFEEVLFDESQCETDEVIILSGVAGVGKTTFTKKMVLDWRNKNSLMEYLTTYDHLLKAECRNTAIKSFDELLHHLMPKVSRNFKPGDMKKVIVTQKVLVILDGLDELNESSAKLLDDILQIKKSFGITLMITTRPEKINFITQKLKSHQILYKHIQLLGVPKEKRDELVTKYYREIIKKPNTLHDIGGLLAYLQKTQLILDDLWRLPYNLTSLAILWAYNHTGVANINTAPELYGEILRLYKTKLEDRLLSNEATRHLDESEVHKRINFFLHSLARESLIGLKNNHIDLPQEAYNRLVDVCSSIQVSIEEMISAFLKRIPGMDIIYSFPHKGLQDFLAAFYIWLNITGKDQQYDVEETLEGIAAVLLQKNVLDIKSQKILRLVRDELRGKPSDGGWMSRTATKTMQRVFPSFRSSSVIQNIMQDIHESTEYDIAQFQNMFKCLLGMFYSEKAVVDESTKLEALQLLQKTGVKDRDAWINILNSVKCDMFVASFISKQPKILYGNIQITDSNVSAYVSLLKSLKPPLKNARQVRVDINIKGQLKNDQELLQLISSHQFRVKRILVNDNNWKDLTAIMRELSVPLKRANEVGVDIQVKESLLELKELLEQINKNEFQIRQLELKKKDIRISDENVNEYTEVFKYLISIRKSVFSGKVVLVFEEECPTINHLLQELSRNRFFVDISFYNDFKHPRETPEEVVEAMNQVFKCCSTDQYTGQVTEDTYIPSTMEQLWLSISNSDSYLKLVKILKTEKKLNDLCVNIPLSIDTNHLVPLPGTLMADLFISEVRTNADLAKAAEIAEKMMPTEGEFKLLFRLFFPKCELKPAAITKLLDELQGIQVHDSIIFPESCKPSSESEEADLQRLAKKSTLCEDGIAWGGSGEGRIFDMTSW